MKTPLELRRKTSAMRLATAFFSVLAIAGLSGQALAACPQELAVYSEVDGDTSIDFRPETEAAIVANSFRLITREGLMLDGMVMWSDEPARAYGSLMLNCPEGDQTGEEIAACTHWQGVVYALDKEGTIGLIPPSGEAAAERLLFPDLARALDSGPLNDGKTTLPRWDVYALSGCQE